MTDIYLTISLSTHNGDDPPQNYERYTVFFHINWHASHVALPT